MSIALESLAEHDRRVRWERRRKDLLTLAEWLLVIAIAGAVGALVTYPYAYDAGKAAEAKRAADAPREANGNCKELARVCLNQLSNQKRKAM